MSPEERREYNRIYREKNRERLLVKGAKWRAANREQQRAWHRRNRKRNREALNLRKRLEPYDLTPEQLARMELEQFGLCKICGCPPEGEGPNAVLHIDHDHATGKVRGLLCQACNRGLGFFRDSPVRLQAAIEYLRR